ncbi:MULTISPECIES: hypothetical protein [unclassified Exiguobacterium]|uniref:hypothetical protein n=1 Tax=unclassified Exiguobacterium TaxID=2644629 RepID=UPI001BE9DB74|nr:MULTISPECIES: hypothetical protein [unclassified Exiguobacterium]
MMELGVLVALIVGINQTIKPFVKVNLLPVISIVLGTVLGAVVLTDFEITERIIYGIALGLTANGTFDLTKVVTKR